MKKEYIISHRTIHKNGKVGGWTAFTPVYDLAWSIDFDKKWAERSGKKVEHRVRFREVTEWKDCEVWFALKSAAQQAVALRGERHTDDYLLREEGTCQG